MKTIAEQLIQLNQIKSDIRQAIISKGVQVAETDGLAVYASKIAAINAIVPTISFSVVTNISKDYQAVDGMTWSQWIDSEYNTDGFTIYDGTTHAGYYVDSMEIESNAPCVLSDPQYVLIKGMFNNVCVSPNDTIESRAAYYAEAIMFND